MQCYCLRIKLTKLLRQELKKEPVGCGAAMVAALTIGLAEKRVTKAFFCYAGSLGTAHPSPDTAEVAKEERNQIYGSLQVKGIVA